MVSVYPSQNAGLGRLLREPGHHWQSPPQRTVCRCGSGPLFQPVY